MLLWRWADAWNLGSLQKSKLQLGLTSTYQDGCEPETGTVVNHQPGVAPGISCSGPGNFVCRYPDTSDPAFDQPHELLTTCKKELPAAATDPFPLQASDLASDVLDTVNFGVEIGEELWHSQPLCAGGEPLLDWFDAAETRMTTCRHVGSTPGAPSRFPCADLDRYLLEIWGCLNASSGEGRQIAQLLAARLPGHQPAFSGAPVYASALTEKSVLHLGAILQDPAGPIEAGNLVPEVQGVLDPLERARVLHWLQGVEQCFSGHQLAESSCPCSSNASCQAGEICAFPAVLPAKRRPRGSCELPDGRQAVCPAIALDMPPPQPCCGDGRKRPEEACDDGNTNSGDGCSWDCRREPGGACCTPGGCFQLTRGYNAAFCTASGGTPFAGRTCQELDNCGAPGEAGACQLPDGRCRMPAFKKECDRAEGFFFAGFASCALP